MEARYVDDGEDLKILVETDHKCPDCGEELETGDIVSLFQIMILGKDGKYEEFTNPDTGHYAYAPYFLHDSCWTTVEEALCEVYEEAGVEHTHSPANAETYCSVCSSGIQAGEPVGVVMMGTLTRSPREPDHQVSVGIDLYPESLETLCLSCVRTINEEVLEDMWPDVSYAGECPQCTFTRNWRRGVPCTHHRFS